MASPSTTDTSKSQWLNTIKTLLASVDNYYIQSCSISVLPEDLEKFNEDAYIPKVVSIGPRFKGSREELLLMEKVKLRCLSSLMHRGQDRKVEEYLEACSSAVWELDKDVRASYMSEIKLDQSELSKIMLLDGCFLLELLISKGLDSQFHSRLLPPTPAPEMLKDDDVLSDLMLLENQIPILVLHKLSQTLFPTEFKPDENVPPHEEEPAIETEQQKREREERNRVRWMKNHMEKMKKEERANKINSLALSVLGYSPLEFSSWESPHLLDLVHVFVNRRTGECGTDNDGTANTNPLNLKLERCALRLIAAGVSIQVIDDKQKRSSCFGLMRDCFGNVLIKLGNFVKTSKQVDGAVEELKGLNFNIKFENGKLKIAQLHITKTTKAKWRNVIAWEHHKYNDDQSSTSPNGKFSVSALILNGLICSSADIKFLKDKNIVVDHTKMTNEELKKFFHSISFGVNAALIDNTYVKLVNELNDYSKACFILWIWKIFWHRFTIRREWIFNFLKRNYNFVALVLPLLSIVQIVYTVLNYKSHK